MKVELFKTIAIQSVSRNNVGGTDNSLFHATALQASTLFSPRGDNELISGVAGGIAGVKDETGVVRNKQNYTCGIIQNNIKT